MKADRYIGGTKESNTKMYFKSFVFDPVVYFKA